FHVAGVAQPAFWGLLATCVAPIPVIGTAIVWVPLCIALWFSGSIAAAVGLAIWGAVAVAGVDNVLRPLFLQRGINAPLFVLVLAILCGLSTFGPVGLVVGPVLVAFSLQAIREANNLLAPSLPPPSPPPPPSPSPGAGAGA
ncbi:MAG: AI-2E family transporter, partial [Deltaproteobacteria bacterium]|nr:AI-2E family transporter [Deltaproteobacteria bacterium]